MAGIGEERRERVKDIAQELNAEEPQAQGGPPTDVDEGEVLARARQQLGLQVVESAAYDTPENQASRQEGFGTAAAEPAESPDTGQPPDSGVEDLDSVVARLRFEDH